MDPSKEQGIEHEPHMQPAWPGSEAAPGSLPNDAPLGLSAHAAPTNEEDAVLAERTVWDEPGLGSHAGAPSKDALTYSRWLSHKISHWSQLNAWTMALAVAMLSGPCALVIALGFFLGSGGLGSDVIVYCGFMPLAQQIAKIAIILWVVEKRPYYFTGWFQLFACTMASCVVFVTVLNVIEYIIPLPFDRELDFLIAWTAFFGMHLITSLFASFGLEKVWRGCITTLKPPKLEQGYFWFMTAYLIHVVYSFIYLIFAHVRMLAELWK